MAQTEAQFHEPSLSTIQASDGASRGLLNYRKRGANGQDDGRADKETGRVNHSRVT